jgi:hypothetical protein
MDVSRRNWLIRLTVGWIFPSVLLQEAVGQDGPQKKVIDVRIEDRKVVTPKGAIRIVAKDVVELLWMSDEAVKLHLHGYDQKLQLRPGIPAAMSITAHATGRFPITSHGWGQHGHGHEALTYLEVHPR